MPVKVQKKRVSFEAKYHMSGIWVEVHAKIENVGRNNDGGKNEVEDERGKDDACVECSTNLLV